MLLFGDLFGQVTEEIPIGKSRSRRDRIDRANWNLSRYTSRSLESSSQTAAVFSCARLKENRKSWKAQEIYFDWLCFRITGYTDVDAPLILRYTKKKIIPTTTIKNKRNKLIRKQYIGERANERKEKQLTIVTLRIYFVSLLTTTRPPLPIHRVNRSSPAAAARWAAPTATTYSSSTFILPPTIFGATAV